MLILFDGVCNLCNGVVSFIIKRDKKNVFKFASLQSAYGEGVVAAHHLQTAPLETIVLVDGAQIYTQSDAVINILKSLEGVWKLAVVFKIIPKPIRNSVYRFISRHRYKVFGKKETCMVPTEELKRKFIDS